MLELIVNILLVIFFIYALFFHVTEAPIPTKVINNPNALSPNIWPSVILVLLIVCVGVNIWGIIRKNRENPDFSFGVFVKSIPGFLKSKVFIGIVIVVVLSFLLEPLGFMLTCFLFLVGYGLLLGDRKYLRLVIVALLVTLLLYIVFGVLLQVNLPRGTVPFLRNFALFVESIVP